MALIACIAGALLAAAGLRYRGHGVFASIVAGALVVPAVVAFTALVFPGGPEARMWAPVAIPVSGLWGVAAAGLGCALASLVRRGARAGTTREAP